MRNFWICRSILIVLIGAPALAQQMRTSEDRSTPAAQGPHSVITFGVFQKMMMLGDFTAKIRLDAAMARHPTTGVGAVADARGEITIYDGKLIVSYGIPVRSDSESAALLAIGFAAHWQTVMVERDVAPVEIEAYLATAAKAHGVDPDTSFPFEAQGTLSPYVMHVNAGPTTGPHGMGLPMAFTVGTSGDQIQGRVAGLYVSADLVGIATHGGERTHAHWVSPDGTSTAHLDRWGLKAGATLLLPKE
jgi:hypothetical protein